MDVEVKVLIQERGHLNCSIKLSGLPKTCEAHELRRYLEENLPNLQTVSEHIMKAHQASMR